MNKCVCVCGVSISEYIRVLTAYARWSIYTALCPPIRENVASEWRGLSGHKQPQRISFIEDLQENYHVCAKKFSLGHQCIFSKFVLLIDDVDSVHAEQIVKHYILLGSILIFII